MDRRKDLNGKFTGRDLFDYSIYQIKAFHSLVGEIHTTARQSGPSKMHNLVAIAEREELSLDSTHRILIV